VDTLASGLAPLGWARRQFHLGGWARPTFAALFHAPLFPVPPVEGAHFVSGDLAVMIGVSLLKERSMTLVLGLKLGPSDCPIAVRIQSTEHPAHHRVTWSMAMAMIIILVYIYIVLGTTLKFKYKQIQKFHLVLSYLLSWSRFQSSGWGELPVHWMPSSSCSRARLLWQEKIDVVLQRSEPAFAATTLGL
jgi:hypothetical protein